MAKVRSVLEGTSRLGGRYSRAKRAEEFAVPSFSPSTLVSRREHPLTNDLSDTETVMLDIERGTYFGLQDVGKVVWEQLESPTRVADLCGYLLTRFEVDAGTCQEEVDYFLAQLLDQGLIEVHDAPAAS